MAKLTDQVGKALKAIEAIELDAGKLDKRVADAERRAAEARAQAAKDRQAKEVAESKVAGLEAEIVSTRASVAGEVATLRAEKEILAQRDRDARAELGRLRQSQYPAGQMIRKVGVTTPPADNYE